MTSDGQTPLSEVLSAYAQYAPRTRGSDGIPLSSVCSLDLRGVTPDQVREAFGDTPPGELVEFWSHCTVARLFEDVEYGQWGLVLLGPGDAAKRTREEVAERPEDYRAGDIIIGEFLGDLDLLVYSPSDSGHRRLQVALPLDERQYWYGVGESLVAFLRSYLAAEGAKFWTER